MDGERFDSLARIFSSRRAALGGLVGGLATALGLPTSEETAAHNSLARCRKLPKPAQRRVCLRRARAHNRKHRCKPKPAAIFCDGRCSGTAVDNCGKRVTCPTCPTGTICLANSGCNTYCSDAPPDCPDGCLCGAAAVEDLSIRLCYQGPPTTTCEQMPQTCSTSADCPTDFYCAAVGAQCVTSRCVPKCRSTPGSVPAP